MIIKTEDFLKHWNVYEKAERTMQAMLIPAKRAIEHYHFNNRSGLEWNSFSVYQASTGKVVVFETTYHWDDRDQEHASYTVPLEVCLQGDTAVVEFFKEQARLQEESATRAGARREAGEKEKRRTEYFKLKQEFGHLDTPEMENVDKQLQDGKTSDDSGTL